MTFRFRNFSIFLMVSDSKIFGIEKSIGIGFGKILVWEKVSVSVSKKFGIAKSICISFEKILVLEFFVFVFFLSILDPKC